MKVSQTNMCFACGKENPCGLKLSFTFESNKAISYFELGKMYQGWEGMAHGGIIATVLDEAMAWAVMNLGIQAVTAALTLRYKLPVPIGKRLKVVGEVCAQRKRTLETYAEIRDENERLLAFGKATYVEISP